MFNHFRIVLRVNDHILCSSIGLIPDWFDINLQGRPLFSVLPRLHNILDGAFPGLQQALCQEVQFIVPFPLLANAKLLLFLTPHKPPGSQIVGGLMLLLFDLHHRLGAGLLQYRPQLSLPLEIVVLETRVIIAQPQPENRCRFVLLSEKMMDVLGHLVVVLVLGVAQAEDREPAFREAYFVLGGLF